MKFIPPAHHHKSTAKSYLSSIRLTRCNKITSRRVYKVSKYKENWHVKFLYAISVRLLRSPDFAFFQILFLNENTNVKYLATTFDFFGNKFFGHKIHTVRLKQKAGVKEGKKREGWAREELFRVPCQRRCTGTTDVEISLTIIFFFISFHYIFYLLPSTFFLYDYTPFSSFSPWFSLRSSACLNLHHGRTLTRWPHTSLVAIQSPVESSSFKGATMPLD